MGGGSQGRIWNFPKGAEPMDLGTKFPKWDPREKSQKGVWGTKLKQKCEIMYNF